MLYNCKVCFDRTISPAACEVSMTVTVNTISAEGFRHTVQIDDHELFADVPKTAGGEGTAPEPHDYFDAALGACKALTVKMYAKKKDIPLTGVGVEVKRDNSQEQKGKYALHVTLTLKGVLTDAQREELLRVADRCPIHKLMTNSEVSIETHAPQGFDSQ
jgi:putative redox protein